MSITGTVAWFTANNSVSLTGMVVKTKVGSNLLIADKQNEATFTDSAFGTALNQSVKGIVEPVSSVDGVNFWYTASSNVSGTGSHIANDFTQYDASDTLESGDYYDEFSKAYNVTKTEANAFSGVNYAVPFVDYAFYLKFTNSESASRNVRMSTCNLTYAGSTGTSNAWRVAVFAKTATKNQESGAITSVSDEVAAGNLKTILRKSGATYFDGTKAVNSGSALATISNEIIDVAATIGSVNPGLTAYYKVTVRLWLEGEDTSCNNETFANLTEDFRLDLGFDISASDGVTNISSAAEAVATVDGLQGTVTLSNTTSGNIANGETASSFQWVNARTGANIANATAYQYTALEAVKAYCLVTTNKGNVYRTNTLDLHA